MSIILKLVKEKCAYDVQMCSNIVTDVIRACSASFVTSDTFKHFLLGQNTRLHYHFPPYTRPHTTRSTTPTIAGRQAGELQTRSVWTGVGSVMGQLGVEDKHMGAITMSARNIRWPYCTGGV